MNPQKKVTVPCSIKNPKLLPYHASQGAAGMDICASIEKPIVLSAGESALVPTGLRLAIPQGYEVQVRPRSGLALKHQITVLNTPGTIDSDYRGEIGIILINHGKSSFTIEPGLRIAQLVLAATLQMELSVSSSLDETERGEGGFGHTGVQHTGIQHTGIQHTGIQHSLVPNQGASS